MKGIGRLFLAAAGAMLVSGPVSAACWSNSTVEAAYVRDFDTILMVSTLRCRNEKPEMTADYNKFVREKRSLLTAANDELRAQLSAGRTAKAGMDAYDRFVTQLANSHGANAEGLSCNDVHALTRAAASSADRAALLQLAVKAGTSPSLPEQACTRQVAFGR